MGSKKVVYLANDDKSAQFRYRVKNMIESLRDGAGWTAKYYLKPDFKLDYLDDIKLLIIERQTDKTGERENNRRCTY